MKRLIIFLTFIFSLSSHAQPNKTEVLKEFLSDIRGFETNSLNKAQTIQCVKDIAQTSASEIIRITPQNIQHALMEAKSFTHCLIFVENHTLIRLIDYEDCSPSYCWKICTPLSKAYIQKSGILNEKNDYLKNIMGCPDSQKRTIFLFN